MAQTLNLGSTTKWHLNPRESSNLLSAHPSSLHIIHIIAPRRVLEEIDLYSKNQNRFLSIFQLLLIPYTKHLCVPLAVPIPGRTQDPKVIPKKL